MTEGIYAETIKQIWPFILTAAVTCVNWLILLSLGLQLSGTRVKRSILFGFTLALAAVDFFGKQAISAPFGSFFGIPLFLFFFKRLCRLSWRQLLLTAVIGFSLAILGKITLTASFRYFLGRAEAYIPYQSLIVWARGSGKHLSRFYPAGCQTFGPFFCAVHQDTGAISPADDRPLFSNDPPGQYPLYQQ